MMHRSRRAVVRTLAALLLAPLVACSDSTAPLLEIDDVTYAPALGVDLSALTRTGSGLGYQDLVVGTGALAEPGKTATVTYIGRLTNGTVFDASNASRPTLTFAIGDVPGADRVLPGFEEGVKGMHVGGLRKIVIPPALGYGHTGSGPVPGNEVIVFDVELVSVP